jgi:putative ABC transport system permease protein
MDLLLQELRYAARRLWRAPGFAAVVIITLALGIGANAAIFTVIDAVMLRPLPYPQPQRLTVIQHYYAKLGPLEAPVSAPGFRDYRDKTQSFEAVGVEAGAALSLTGAGDPQRVEARRISGDWFRALGVTPALGRAILPEDDQPGHHVAVLSSGLWRRIFASAPEAVGKTLQLDGEAYTVVGVMPAGFADPYDREAQLWVPLALTPAAFEYASNGNEWLTCIARLKAGVTLAQANDEMGRFAKKLQGELGALLPQKDWTLRVVSLSELSARSVRPMLLVLLGAVLFVLCIACANVANLVLVRGAVRSREVAIRAALGGDRWALARPLLAESVLLALAGCGLGLLFARFGVDGLLVVAGDRLPRTSEIAMNPGVVLFALALSLASALLFGMVPALKGSRANLYEALSEGGRSGGSASSHRLRGALVVAEVALALTLLVGAGLLIRSFARLVHVDPGFDPRGVLTFSIAIPGTRYPDRVSQTRFFDDVLAGISRLPGVKAAGATNALPFGDSWSTSTFSIEGRSIPAGEQRPWGDLRIVSPGFFQALRVPLLEGRFIEEGDGPAAPRVAIVDEELARRYFPGRDPVGTRVTFDSPTSKSAEWFTIAGVVGHAMQEGLDASPRVQVYLPLGQAGAGDKRGAILELAVRGDRAPLSMATDVRAAVRAVDPLEPIANVSTLEEGIQRSMGQRRLALLLLGVFAALALGLASLGIYGVISHNVAQRTRELGIRMALGAARGDVLGLVVTQGIRLTAAGIGIGALAALALTRVLQGQLYGIHATDPLTFAVTAALLAAVALLASLLPGLRATRVDPAVALRTE